MESPKSKHANNISICLWTWKLNIAHLHQPSHLWMAGDMSKESSSLLKKLPRKKALLAIIPVLLRTWENKKSGGNLSVIQNFSCSASWMEGGNFCYIVLQTIGPDTSVHVCNWPSFRSLSQGHWCKFPSICFATLWVFPSSLHIQVLERSLPFLQATQKVLRKLWKKHRSWKRADQKM